LQTSLLPGRSQKDELVLIDESLLKPFQEGLELTGLEKTASGRAKARAKVPRSNGDFGIIFILEVNSFLDGRVEAAIPGAVADTRKTTSRAGTR
jgi:hypothetical protein